MKDTSFADSEASTVPRPLVLYGNPSTSDIRSLCHFVIKTIKPAGGTGRFPPSAWGQHCTLQTLWICFLLRSLNYLDSIIHLDPLKAAVYFKKLQIITISPR